MLLRYQCAFKSKVKVKHQSHPFNNNDNLNVLNAAHENYKWIHCYNLNNNDQECPCVVNMHAKSVKHITYQQTKNGNCFHDDSSYMQKRILVTSCQRLTDTQDTVLSAADL